MSLCAGLGSKLRLSKLCMRKGMFLKFKLFISFHITVTKSSTKEKSANAWTDSWKSKLADCKHMYKTLKLLDFIILSRLTMHDQWGTIRRNRTTRQNQIKKHYWNRPIYIRGGNSLSQLMLPWRWIPTEVWFFFLQIGDNVWKTRIYVSPCEVSGTTIYCNYRSAFAPWAGFFSCRWIFHQHLRSCAIGNNRFNLNQFRLKRLTAHDGNIFQLLSNCIKKSTNNARIEIQISCDIVRLFRQLVILYCKKIYLTRQLRATLLSAFLFPPYEK